MLLYFVFFFLLFIDIRSQIFNNNELCFYRCTASCVGSGQTSGFCAEECASYNNTNLCNTSACWTNCLDLGPFKELPVPGSIDTIDANGSRSVYWGPVPDASAYLIQFKTADETAFENEDIIMTSEAKLTNFASPELSFCDAVDVRVAAASKTGVSNFSTSAQIGKPDPSASPKLLLKEMKYLNQTFVDEFYQANGTIEITFEYTTYDWPLGESDLQIEPMFHMITCADPDLSQSVPLPNFKAGSAPNTIVGLVGSDMMYRKCRFVYYMQSVTSKTCGTTTYFHSPPPDALQTLNIDCSNVLNSPCVVENRHEPPVCGQIRDMNYVVLNDDVDAGDKAMNLTLNITFDPLTRKDEGPTLYYVAFYGLASEYKTKEEEAFLGVNITKVLGQTSNCMNFTSDGLCAHSTNNSVFLNQIHLDTLYGITFCAVKDPENLEFPNLMQESRALKPMANRIYVNSADFAKSRVGIIVGCTVAAVALLILLAIALCCFINKKQKAKNDKFKLKITQLQLEKEHRYTEFPKKSDIWEIERRNLIIHDDKKLGSGAFGAVYLGKLLGKSLAHKDANSPLGVNIMRAENCEVAVKMLPEYADEMSKSEFLREIGLMKTLGYHERLVNMLACVTDSEPLCLVVEYCSNGDLLHFLRDRCKYMMKLDGLGINYQEPPVDNNYDIERIITLKQLLMYAVQVSYGLEYLSQKGFVHRDVAARNILVHDLNSCKIGDFGLCRFIYSESSHYKSKGGRLPLKWMSPEAIRYYEFSNKSDVWSFGILLFEIITLGGSPYPGVQPEDMLTFLEGGGRMEQPDNCPDQFHAVMSQCWAGDPENRPEFSSIRQQLASQLEDITEEYSYLKLDAQRDYYNVQYKDEKPDVIIIPETESISSIPQKAVETSSSTVSIESLPIDSMIIDPNEDIDRTKAAIKAAETEKQQYQENQDNESISISMSTVNNVQS